MSRMVGTVSMGIRAPIIRSGDDLVEIDQQRAGEAGQDAALFVFGHGCTSPLTMIKSGLHTFTGKRGFEHVLIRL